MFPISSSFQFIVGVALSSGDRYEEFAEKSLFAKEKIVSLAKETIFSIYITD